VVAPLPSDSTKSFQTRLYPGFRIGNVYACQTDDPPHSFTPNVAFERIGFSYLVAGDFKILNPAADPLRAISSKEERESAPYFELATNVEFSLLNTPYI